MEIEILNSKAALGKKAALKGTEYIRKAIESAGEANIIVATGASQFEMLDVLIKQEIDWSKVTAFHLDEYIGISEKHPASFRKYLKERFVEKVHPKAFHYINGNADPITECKRLAELIGAVQIDVAFVGIGENGHLAFNDPPADFETEEPYLAVSLDEKCRIQQMGEGWFSTLDDVPTQAISMSVRHIMKSKTIICSVPDQRKAEAVRASVEGDISNMVPASVLQRHPSTFLFLDTESASLLNKF